MSTSTSWEERKSCRSGGPGTRPLPVRRCSPDDPNCCFLFKARNALAVVAPVIPAPWRPKTNRSDPARRIRRSSTRRNESRSQWTTARARVARGRGRRRITARSKTASTRARRRRNSERARCNICPPHTHTRRAVIRKN